MSLLVAVAAMLAALGLQTLAGQIWTDAARHLPLLLVPVAVYGASVGQRSAMWVGCAAGLLCDAWFQVGAFGATGFKWTLLGWMLGGASHRVDLGRPGGRFIAGAAVALGDQVLDLGLRRLLDQPAPGIGFLASLVRASVTGLLVEVIGSMVDRIRDSRALRDWT